MTAPNAGDRPGPSGRSAWSGRLVFAAAVAFGVLLVLDLVVVRLLWPALLGLAACGVWFRRGRTGRRGGWLAIPLLIVAAVWFAASPVWAVPTGSWYGATLTPRDAPSLRAEQYPVSGGRESRVREYSGAEDAAVTRITLREVPSAPPALVPGADPIGAGAAVLALAGVVLARPRRFGDVRRPTWDVREIALLVVAALLIWLGGAAWAVLVGLAGVAVLVIWLQRVR